MDPKRLDALSRGLAAAGSRLDIHIGSAAAATSAATPPTAPRALRSGPGGVTAIPPAAHASPAMVVSTRTRPPIVGHHLLLHVLNEPR